MSFTGIVAIELPDFRAGIAVHKNRVIKAPKRLQYMDGWTLDQLEEFVDSLKKSDWKLYRLREESFVK
jgi:hypothetical protein